MNDLIFLLNGRGKSIPAAARFSFDQGHYSVNGEMKTFAELFTVTRATTAWDVADGALVEYASGNPVVNSKGIAVFEASTNLLTNNDGALATYPSTAGAVADGTPFITGFDNAVEFTSAPGLKSAYKTTTYSASTDYTFSCYIKTDDGSAPVTGTTAASGIDLVVVMYGAAYASDVLAIGDDVYRITCTANSAALTSTAFGIIKYGSNSSKGFTVLGYQLEQSDFASPIIITEGATVTRNADIVVSNAAISSWYNDSEGTLYASFTSPDPNSINNRIAQVDDGSSSNRLLVYTSGLDTINGLHAEGGVVQSIFSSSPYSFSSDTKTAYAYKANDFEQAVNGASIGTDVAGAVPVGINALRMGANESSTTQLNGYIKEFRYYNTRLPQAQMLTITG